MQLLLVLALLPFIYILAWAASPALVALHSIVVVAERLRTNAGPLAEAGFFVALAMLTTLCGKSWRFFWFGLLPVIVGCIVVVRS